MTQNDYAKHAGITRARVGQLVKGGMPIHSLAASD